jgi:hypothetical protein
MKTVPEFQSLSGSCPHLLGVDPHTPRCIRWTLSVGVLVLLALTTVPISSAQENLPLLASAPSEAFASSSRLTLNSPENSFLPLISPPPLPRAGVDWYQLLLSSSSFLAFSHAFRCATEQGTRDAFSGPFVGGYLKSVGNMHGWADGDDFLVNYVGHPMEGSVAGFIWQHNDRDFRDVRFGKNARYWKAKLRGAAFAYLFSMQFEIGPLSEASLGHVQATYPAQGFVDHVVTPVIGLGWTIVEDSLDRHVIRRIEARTPNPYARALMRGLNPARSFANMFEGQFPWSRDDRPSPFSRHADGQALPAEMERENSKIEVHPTPGVAPFEFTVAPNVRQYVGSGSQGSCVGGGASAALRIASDWQIVVDVNGCKLRDLKPNLTGDSLSYMTGPRWTPNTSSRWSPSLQVLVGGTKMTEERTDPELRKQLLEAAKPADNLNDLHMKYTQQYETNGFAVAAGIGMDYKINNALAIRVASLDYTRSWIKHLSEVNYQNGMQFTMGMVLRMGTW